MTQITASVNSQPITATVNASGSISASVGSSVVTANAGGGIGPQGPAGTDGGNLEQLANVQLSNVAAGDLLRYGSGGKWQNYPERDLVVDAGNF
jgi:hypothetical protein